MSRPTAPTDLAAKDCQIKVGLFPDLSIQFSQTGDFQESIVVNKSARSPSGLPAPSLRTFSFLMKGKSGHLTVRENFGDAHQAFVRLDRDSFFITQYDNRDSSGNPSSIWTIHLTLRPGVKPFLVQYDGFMMKKNPVSFYQYLEDYSVLRHHRKFIQEKARHLKIVVPAYRSVQLEVAFNPDLARRILHQELLTDYRVIPAGFVRLQRRAVEAEDRVTIQKHDTMRRKNVRVVFNKMENPINRFYVELHQQPSDPVWTLQGQERIILHVADEKAGRGGIFDLTPTKIPGSPKQGFWSGTVFFRDGKPCAAINNRMTPDLITKMGANREASGVNVVFDDDEDPNVTRAVRALTNLEYVLSSQIDEKFQGPSDPDIKLNYNIPPAGILMGLQRRLIRRHVPILSNRGGDIPWEQYQLTQPSHQTAIRNAFTSECGISLIQGPPATGKTELVSKLIGITLKHSTLAPGDSIVLTAHTNVAVGVACQRFLKHAKNMFGFSRDMVCLYWSRNKMEYGRLSQKELAPELMEITLDAHMDRLADSDKRRYQNYLGGRSVIKANGRIDDPKQLKLYLADVVQLTEILKKTVRVWFATLASFHTRSHVFGTEKHLSPVKCGLLVIDEASQAHSTAAWLPWHVLDPKRIVFAGDHLQLAPHFETTEGEWAWKESLFEQLRNDPAAQVPQVTLDLQFRTVSNIYAGTNAFYDGRVQPHASTAGRPISSTILQVVRRIHFVDQKGAKFQLSKNTHWFDIQNGITTASGETSSSTNQQELRFIIGLFAALQYAGAPANLCMLLTGYQAMYDDLVHEEKRLPNSGTVIKKVDGAQGDEASIVGITLVRNKEAGLGFMASARRQNVMTSRAQNAMFGVGHVEVMRQAKIQNHTAWMNWFERMVVANGANWCISFYGPVVWFVDGKRLDVHNRTTPTQEAPEPNTFTIGAVEDAVESQGVGVLPIASLSGGSVHSPTGSPSSPVGSTGVPRALPIRSVTPAGSPRASFSGSQTPPGTPPQSSTPSGRSSHSRPPSVGSIPPISGHHVRQLSTGGRPRAGSLLNPQHERRVSTETVLTGGILPKNINLVDLMPGINRIEQNDVESLKKLLQKNLLDEKQQDLENYNKLKPYLAQAIQAKKTADQIALDNVIAALQSSKAPISIINTVIYSAHAARRIYQATGLDVVLP